MTALSDLNHMGTSSSEKRNDLAKEIWSWCAQHNIWLTAVHIPGVEKVEADKQSRQSHSQLEWTLDRTIFRDCLNVVKLVPNIDLFASRPNHQLQPYVSWHPDLGAVQLMHFIYHGSHICLTCSLHFLLSAEYCRRSNGRGFKESSLFRNGQPKHGGLS